jgi:hypothetical protein
VIVPENEIAQDLPEGDVGEVETIAIGEMTLVIATDVDAMNQLTPKERHDEIVVNDLTKLKM